MIRDFEETFSDFLDRREYDQAGNALFSIVRVAYMAGWLAAGGEPPPPQRVVELLPKHIRVPKVVTLETDIKV